MQELEYSRKKRRDGKKKKKKDYTAKEKEKKKKKLFALIFFRKECLASWEWSRFLWSQLARSTLLPRSAATVSVLL